jgi:hypothetical protein
MRLGGQGGGAAVDDERERVAAEALGDARHQLERLVDDEWLGQAHDQSAGAERIGHHVDDPARLGLE